MLIVDCAAGTTASNSDRGSIAVAWTARESMTAPIRAVRDPSPAATSTVSPTDQPFFSAAALRTTMSPLARLAVSPETTWTSRECWKIPGSTPTTTASVPSSVAAPTCSASTRATPGRPSTCWTSSAGTSRVADCSRKSAVDSVSTIARVEAWVEAASTDAAPTSAMPIISALAVDAVRRGLRVTLPRASPPSGRIQATAGAASTRRPAGTTLGASISAPITTAPAPIPSTGPGWPRSATVAVTTAAMPAAVSTPPATARSTEPRSWVGSSSRIASTGAVSAARRAGTSAATTLRVTPTTTATATVNASSGICPDSSIPIAPSTARSTATSPTPAATPSAEPSRPIATAWTRTEPNTWFGDAPIARSMANSR